MGGSAGDTGGAAAVFITVFYVLMLIPCIGIGWLGWDLLTRLGRYPSKTPAIQMSVLFKLVVVEVLSITLILVFFKALTAQ
jgi:TRAP-type C4-dicarboxylate transport system permease small subunit